MATRTSNKELFSDINIAFSAHPVTGALTRKIDREAVKQSIRSLVLTDRGERFFQPEIGGSVRGFLFELFTPLLKQRMEDTIKNLIINYEPRAEVLRVVVEDRSELNSLLIIVAFRIKNDPTPVVLDLILERVR